jgi:hypothetical protein
MQDHGKGLQPVAFESQKLRAAELNYAVHEKEALAVVHALQTWRCYVLGKEITVKTDHESLKYLQTQPQLSRRQGRWMELLQNFSPGLKLEYSPGKTNPADAFSRRPDLMAITEATWSEELQQMFTRAYAEDPRFADGRRNPQWVLAGNLWYTRSGPEGRLCVPNNPELQHKLLKETHDSPLGGHFGGARTIARLNQNFHWPGLKNLVRRYVRTCEECAMNKPTNTKSSGLMQPLPIPNKPWEVVSMDFIVGLPMTRQGYDAIFVVVDTLTKMAHFIPTKTKATAKTTADLFFQTVVRMHGLPSKIISDRDSKFISHFWRDLFGLCGTELAMSSAYHPQTDGQTERMNRTLVESLRSYIQGKEATWDNHLVAVEIAYNSSVQESTKKTPFSLNYGYEPTFPLTMAGNHLPTPAAQNYLDKQRKAIISAKQHIEGKKKKQKQAADHRRRHNTFNVGDLVRLNTENIRFANSIPRKFIPRFTRPFRITRKISDVTYALDLPENWQIHNVFHISLLRKFEDPDTVFPNRRRRYPDPEIVDDYPEYEIEKILRHTTRRNRHHYLIRWKGYGPEEDSWVHEKDMHARDLLRRYWRTQSRA